MIFSEVSARLFPWDFVDENPDVILDNLERDTLTNSFYPVVLMHDEKRPLSEFYYPHNPRRKVYWTEDSRAYWHFDPEFYRNSRITPLRSENPELVDTDWIQFSVDLARRRNLNIGVELSHTWVDKRRLESEFPDCVQVNLRGTPQGGRLCPNSPDALAYGKAMVTELVTRYDLDFIQTCFHGFSGGLSFHSAYSEMERLLQLPLGGCFCENCAREAEKRGINWNAIKDRLSWIADGHVHYNHKQAFDLALLRSSITTATRLLLEIPELYTWMQFRCDSYTAFWKELYTAAHAAKKDIDVRFNDNFVFTEMIGFNLRDLAPYFDSIRGADYFEQEGDGPLMEMKAGYFHSLRRSVGLDKHFITALSQRKNATPELIKRAIRISAKCGADGTSIANYDTATPDLMRAVREGFEEAGITVRRR